MAISFLTDDLALYIELIIGRDPLWKCTRKIKELLNSGIGHRPNILMTQIHVLGLDFSGIRVHNRFQSKGALMQPKFKHCLEPISPPHKRVGGELAFSLQLGRC